MKRFSFLICYDIASPQRLRRIAKTLENCAIRIQKSIFYGMDMSKKELSALVLALEEIIDEKEDDIRIYKVDKHHSLHLNSGVDLMQPNLLVGEEE